MAAAIAPAHAPPLLQAFSRSLLQLAEQARQAQPQDLLQRAMQILRALVPFDAAWWGEVSAEGVHGGPRNWLHGSIGLSRSFATEWNGLAAVDAFGKLSMARLGEVVRERDMPADVPEHPEVAAFSERHGLYHCMALTAELPDSGLMFFVSVYRPPHRTGFTDAETVLFGEFVFHLLQHWHHLLQRLQSSSPGRPWDSFALAEPSGELLFAGLRISMALGEAYPEWTGSRLPAPVVQALPGVPCNLVVGSKPCRLRLEPCGPLVAVSMASRHVSP